MRVVRDETPRIWCRRQDYRVRYVEWRCLADLAVTKRSNLNADAEWFVGWPTSRRHKRFPLIFYRTRAGREPVREWLQRLDATVLHGFIKKTRATPDSDLATARTRQKELER